jgi:hypothetical protein
MFYIAFFSPFVVIYKTYFRRTEDAPKREINEEELYNVIDVDWRRIRETWWRIKCDVESEINIKLHK